MLTWWRARSRPSRTAAELYGSIVTAARRETFYSGLGTPDTPDGRFVMLLLHMYLALERLHQEGEAGQKISRALVERFVTDMDDCMRELGVGDLTVPRKVKKAAGALYDWAADFRQAEASGGEAGLAAALEKRLQPFLAAPAARQLASYIRRQADVLREQPAEALLSGRILFAEMQFGEG